MDRPPAVLPHSEGGGRDKNTRLYLDLNLDYPHKNLKKSEWVDCLMCRHIILTLPL